MRTFKTIMEMLFGFLAMALYVLATIAAWTEHYQQAIFLVLSAVFMTMQENQVHRDLKEDDE